MEVWYDVRSDRSKPQTQKIMSSRSTSLLMLVTGIAAGAALGILFAPAKGKDTRAKIAKTGEDLYDRLKDLVGQAQDQLAERAAQMKEKVGEAKSEAQRHTSRA